MKANEIQLTKVSWNAFNPLKTFDRMNAKI